MTTGNFFCGIGGNDGDNGLLWSTKKLTSQALLNLGDALGDQIYVLGAGRFVENHLFPAYAGAAGAWNQLIGDTEGNILDGGSNVSGLSPNWIVLDGSDSVYGIGRNAYELIDCNNRTNWDRWRLRNLAIQCGDDGLYVYNAAAPISLEVYDSIIWGPNQNPLMFSTENRCDENPSEPHKIIRCLVAGDYGVAAFRQYGQTGGFSTNPGLEIEDSIFCTKTRCLVMQGAVDQYGYVRAKRTLFINWPGILLPTTGMLYGYPTYDKAHFEDCVFIGANLSDNGGLFTYDNCHWWPVNSNASPPTGVTAHRDGLPFIAGGFPLWPFMTLPTGGETSGTDIRGEARTSAQVGGLIYIAKKLQQYGILDTSIGAVPAWDASGGGGTGRVGVMRVLGGR